MRKKINYCFFLLAAITMVACSDDSAHTGSSLMDRGDSVLVFVDTIGQAQGFRTSLMACSPIISDPDSLLLGEMDNGYGTIRAEILTQLACPVGYRYPEGAVMDSVCLYVYYQSYSGSGYSPLQIDVREMDRATLKYSSTYYSDVDTADYVSPDARHVLARKHIVVPATPLIEVSSSSATFSCVRMRMEDEWAKNFFDNIRDFSSQETFNKQMKGLYIYTDFGGSAILNVNSIALSVYYHFTYQKGGSDSEHTNDTTVSDMKAFYANSEVRQINRITYLDNNNSPREGEDIVQLLQNPDSDFVVSPGGVYTGVSIPMRALTNRIYDRIRGKRVYVNKAEILVRVRNYYTGSEADKTRANWMQPASHVLLVRDYAVNSFFREKQLPSDTLALLGTLSSTEDDEGKTMYYYSYDVSALLTMQLRDSAYVDSVIRMVMVPVSVESTTSTSSGTTAATSVKQSQELSTTIINSAQRSDQPMVLEVVYSGF